ncbi:hypothetical protein DFH08DRAFT_1029411 [Mycena albidolilacea]|uniref:Uncharacterized protein n=1 Tax=Mycena albidolilacea TaxID=1033008 RepID=A0AAD7EHX6_9AGAR|nr:hypothetical protein DFH08DRAFT_1029411 [Mycena albidolilacea]
MIDDYRPTQCATATNNVRQCPPVATGGQRRPPANFLPPGILLNNVWLFGILALFPYLHSRHPPKDDESDATTLTTPQRHPHLVTGLPPSAPTTPQIQRAAQELFPSPPPASPPLFARVVGSHEHADSVDSGADGRHSYAAEQALYAQLAMTPVGALNDMRHAFMIAAKGAGRGLASLQPVLTLAVLNDKNSLNPLSKRRRGGSLRGTSRQKHFAERCRKSNSRLGKGAEAENMQLSARRMSELGNRRDDPDMQSSRLALAFPAHVSSLSIENMSFGMVTHSYLGVGTCFWLFASVLFPSWETICLTRSRTACCRPIRTFLHVRMRTQPTPSILCVALLLGLRTVPVGDGSTGRLTGTGPGRRGFDGFLLRDGYGTGSPVKTRPVPDRIRPFDTQYDVKDEGVARGSRHTPDRPG